MTQNSITKQNLISQISRKFDIGEIKDGIMNLIPRRIDLIIFNSAKALIPMFHMMTSLVIYAEIIDLATEHGQITKK